MLGGSLALGGGTYLWLRESTSTSVLTSAILGAGVTAIAAGAELYLTDEDPSPTGPRYIRDSATQGAVIGASGLVLAGAGIWLWHREASASGSDSSTNGRTTAFKRMWLPTIVAGSSHAMALCIGSF
jgi:hypothetical protein